MARAGFNTIMHWRNMASLNDVARVTKWADQYGLALIDFLVVNFFDIGKVGHQMAAQKKGDEQIIDRVIKDTEQVLPQVRRRVEIDAGSPSLLGYFNVDEPNLGHWPSRLAVAHLYHEKLQASDGYHPVFALYAPSGRPTIPPAPEALRIADVFLYNIYIYRGWDRFSCTSNYMSAKTHELKRRMDEAHKVPMVVPLAEMLDPKRCPRPMRPDEQRAQTYLAVIHGAKGLLYYSIARACFS